MMAFNQIDEEETGPKKRTAFEEFQNALQSVITSYVECPQVTQTFKSFSLLHQGIKKLLFVCFGRLK